MRIGTGIGYAGFMLAIAWMVNGGHLLGGAVPVVFLMTLACLFGDSDGTP